MKEDKALFGNEEEREGKKELSGYVTGTLFFLWDRKTGTCCNRKGKQRRESIFLHQISLMVNTNLEAFLKAEEL